VLLHELAHSLGVPHEVDAHTMMSARYDHKTDSFSPAASKLMRMSLSRELDPAAEAGSFPDAAIAHLRATSERWVAPELERALAFLDQSRAAAAAASSAAAAAPPPPTSRLTAADRARLDRALQEQNAGRMNDAWATAHPLFDAYPETYEVQDLRCQLAIMRARPQKEIQNECATLGRLSPAAASKKDPGPARKR
jgi:hypothetical protein